MTAKRQKSGATQDQIDAIYQAYPRHLGTGKAKDSIRKALAKVGYEELMDAVTAYSKAVRNQEREFIPYPATWFNQERWLDDRSEWGPQKKQKSTALGAWEMARQAVRNFGTYEPEKARASLPPSVAKVVKEIGWRRFCEANDMESLKARFNALWSQQ